MVENFFGEAIMLHQDHLLGDVLRDRPVIVKYKSPVNYVVEGIIVILFILGLIAGRKSRFLWLTIMFFLFDFALHIGLGFGINEVYIMTAHYMYAPPYRYRLSGGKSRNPISGRSGKRWIPVWKKAFRELANMGTPRIAPRPHTLSMDKQRLSAG